MSTTYAGPLRLIGEGLDELAAIGPEFRTTGEKQELPASRLSRLIARAEAERLRVLAGADDIAVETGARSTAAWLADETRDAHGTVRRHAALAASARPEVDPDRGRVRGRRGEPGPDPGDRRSSRGPARRPGRRPAGQGRDPAGHRGRQARAARAEDVRVPDPGVPGPRHRRGGRVPEAARRGAARPGGDQALLPSPRRRLHRPQRPDPRPPRQPAPHLPRRLHLTAQQAGSATSTTSPCPAAAARRSAPSWRTCPPPACPAKAAPPPPSPSPSTRRPSSPTSAPPASPSPPPATRSPPTKPAGSPARPGSCPS